MMQGFLRMAFLVVAGVVLSQLTACGLEETPKSASPQPPVRPTPVKAVQATADAGQTVDEDVPFWDEWEALEPAWEKAQPLTESYPSDPALPVVADVADVLGGKKTTTAFGAAILRGNREQVDAYLESGADVRAPIWSISEGQDLPIRSFAADLAVHAVAIDAADAEFLTHLLKRGADPNAITTTYSRDKRGRLQCSQASTLFDAVACGNLSTLKALLEYGVADVDRGADSSTASMSPLFTAVTRNSVESVKLLLEHGADPNAGSAGKDPGSKSKSPLAMAQMCLERQRKPGGREKAEAIIKLLRKHGAE